MYNKFMEKEIDYQKRDKANEAMDKLVYNNVVNQIAREYIKSKGWKIEQLEDSAIHTVVCFITHRMMYYYEHPICEIDFTNCDFVDLVEYSYKVFDKIYSDMESKISYDGKCLIRHYDDGMKWSVQVTK